MKRHQASRLGALSLRLVLACLGYGVASMCLADPIATAPSVPIVIPPSMTSMTSTADRMISYRHQNHMWQTSDGAMHVMINRGTQPSGDSLQLFSSFDQGFSWVGSVALANSDEDATSDGYLDNGLLYMTYSTPAREIVFAILQYNVSVRTWTLVQSETAYSSPSIETINPALASDAMGRLWLAFVARTTPGGNYSIKLLRKVSDAEGWVDTGFVFGEVDNLSIERSARPVATSTGIGMVYTVHQKIYWAARDNQWPLAQAWSRQLLFTSQANDNDPYESHFSVAADSRKNIHMVTPDGGRLLYLRFDAASRSWNIRYLTSDIQAGYPQLTIMPGVIAIAVNMSTQAAIYQSRDSGTTFSYTQQLIHGTPAAGVSYANPRLETPTNSLSPLPLLQQYVDNGTQRLLFYSTPVILSSSH